MTKYENKQLSKATFVMEESFFVNCVLTDCDLFYSGGECGMVESSVRELPLAFSWIRTEDDSNDDPDRNVEAGADTTNTPCWKFACELERFMPNLSFLKVVHHTASNAIV